MLQAFEWDLLGSMIYFQAKYRVSQLNVVRDTFNREERRKMRATRYVVAVNIAYHVVKIAIPVSTLINCNLSQVSTDECSRVTKHRIKLMLYCDCAYATLLFIYEMWAMFRLIYFSWKRSRFEARIHMAYLVLNSLGMFLALPLIINGLLAFLLHYEVYTELRWVYYQDNLAKVLPSLIYILTKKNEDCFSCFNRLAP